MPGRVLLDTNAVIDMIRQRPGVVDHVERAEQIFVSAVSVGELYYGARKSARAVENIRQVEALVAGSAVLGCDGETAGAYGWLKDAQRRKGRPVPENDLWIAAQAVQHRLTLVTRDTHFNGMDGVQTTSW